MIVIPIAASAHRGFIKSVSGIVSLVAAVFLAAAFAPMAASMIDNSGLKKSLNEKFDITVFNMSRETDENGETSDGGKKFSEQLKRFGVDLEKIKKDAESGIQEKVDDISESAASYIADKLTFYFCCIVIFIASYFILRLIFWLISKFTELPVLRRFDSLLGALIGVVTAALFAFVFTNLFSTVLPYLNSAYPDLFPEDIIENTLVYRFAANVLSFWK